MQFQTMSRDATAHFLCQPDVLVPACTPQLRWQGKIEWQPLTVLLAWDFCERAAGSNLQLFRLHVQLHVQTIGSSLLAQTFFTSQHVLSGVSFDSIDASPWYNHGSFLEMKYRKTYAMHDLDAAIDHILLACIYTPHDHPFRPSRLASLAACYGHRFERLHAHEDLDRALCLSLAAVDSCRHDNADYPTYANSVGSFHALKYQHLSLVLDLDEAISWMRRAIDAALIHNMSPAESYSNLGVMLGWKFERMGIMSDLDAALKFSELAISTTHSQSDRATSLSNLADLLVMSNMANNDLNSLRTALVFYREVWNDERAPSLVRLKAAKKASNHLNALEEWNESSEILQGAVELLSDISSRCLSRKDQQYILSECASLGTNAASVILQAGRSVLHALRVLEIGRGVIASLSIESRGEDQRSTGSSAFVYSTYDHDPYDTNIKRRAYPMEDNLETAPDGKVGVQAALEGGSTGHFYPKDDTAFEKQLLDAARHGPLIVINESPIRCDAMLVETDGIRHVPLPDLHSEDITAYSKELMEIRKLRQSNNTNCDIHRQLEIFGWLWHAAARPALGGLETPPEPGKAGWPRVWWILTGRLSQLPIHAAGQCGAHFSESVMDRVVSSYCPSIRALIQSRRAPTSYEHHLKHVTVSMDKTPDLPTLACAREEVKYVATFTSRKPSRKPINLKNPVKKKVVEQLNGAHVFHFAGHGKSNASDPLSSCLVLKDWQEDPLTVEDLLKRERKPTKQFLAYLSACGTGLNQAEDLLDESIYLMSAFQIIGFRHVIGAMWEVEDRSAVQMAEGFYHELGNGETGSIGNVTDYLVAFSLHQAAIRLRNQSLSNPNAKFLDWAPYIHFGP